MAEPPHGIDAFAFGDAMEGFAPFESAPLVAIGVSGGPDSMALALLLDIWARGRGGAIVALTVDHGLRPESGAEAAQIGAWLAERGIAHAVLRWEGLKPVSGIQAAAREARYGVLATACAERGIVHLAIAHHADDQAETILFRREHGSFADGMAGMPASRSLGPVRLIRPLLGWPKSALAATCAAFGQAALDDPSNRAPRYARTALRQRLADDDVQRDLLPREAASAGADRGHKELSLARFLGRVAMPRPDGAVVLDRAPLIAAEPGLRLGALSASLRFAGGRPYAPSPDAVARVDAAIRSDAFRGASLAGCLVRPWREGLLICREPDRIAPPIVLAPGEWQRWDGRFVVRVGHGGFRHVIGPQNASPLEGEAGPKGRVGGWRRLTPDTGKAARVPPTRQRFALPTPDQVGGRLSPSRGEVTENTVGALGRADYAWLRRRLGAELPAVIASGLPAVRSAGSLVAVPGLGWSEPGFAPVEQRLEPLWPLASERFTVVYAGNGIMSDTEPEPVGKRRS